MFQDNDPLQHDEISRAETEGAVDELIDEIREDGLLDERERYIFENRIMSEDPRTLLDIGKDLGVSRERVRQLQSGIIEKIRAHISERPEFHQRLRESYEILLGS